MSVSEINIEKMVRSLIKKKGRKETRKELEKLKDFVPKGWCPDAIVSLIQDIGNEGLTILDKQTLNKE